MKRILFVDDEPLLLEVMEARFGTRASSWEMDFAPGGEDALSQMFRKRYDVIVADMRIDIERPRHARALQKDHHFHDLYAHIWEKLEEGMGNTKEPL